jgi:DNA-binding transcriptional MerR regulator
MLASVSTGVIALPRLSGFCSRKKILRLSDHTLDLPVDGTCTFLSRHIAQGGTAMERPLTVGQLARATGVPAKTIRYYEQVGILPVPRRSGAGYRHYSRHDVHRLLFIRRARALGLSLTNLKALTAELDSGECLSMRPPAARTRDGAVTHRPAADC